MIGRRNLPPQLLVKPDLYAALKSLHDLLARDYGQDFAYTIVAQGKYLAASNYKDGVIEPISQMPRS